ncbi:ogr/Delta-like zinc finger family protein [Chitiniphilus purpureus]|uniref:Ogr/Delta-like zinc finger family protein n=1 Tax=Chitiniphilus purpureus TaxID=2981137 RepID=A0ABY6DQS1_9NEIS|nr:ogr/Delta-like zinc finger family protein [Chitiniphilus sp. CD1]UXY16699.1 ogr/Delta-like zinc finger family protein [Chitiniphilus sp. CD1]
MTATNAKDTGNTQFLCPKCGGPTVTRSSYYVSPTAKKATNQCKSCGSRLNIDCQVTDFLEASFTPNRAVFMHAERQGAANDDGQQGLSFSPSS